MNGIGHPTAAFAIPPHQSDPRLHRRDGGGRLRSTNPGAAQNGLVYQSGLNQVRIERSGVNHRMSIRPH